jgi:hypothetical protein
VDATAKLNTPKEARSEAVLMVLSCCSQWSLNEDAEALFRFLEPVRLFSAERSTAAGAIRTLLRRQPRSPRRRSKRFELTEKAHKVASLEMMVIDLEYMAMELARQISTEEERTGVAKCGAVGRADDNQGSARLM